MEVVTLSSTQTFQAQITCQLIGTGQNSQICLWYSTVYLSIYQLLTLLSTVRFRVVLERFTFHNIMIRVQNRSGEHENWEGI